ncbi:MAG: prenyltransferase/squalene oxidase repeat-containing protein [Planctomycetota bacterium]
MSRLLIAFLIMNSCLLIAGCAAGRPEPMGRGTLLPPEPVSREPVDPVGLGLSWLTHKQASDGRWSSHDPANERVDGGYSGFDVGVTSLALLAYVNYGETHRSAMYPQFKDSVQRGVDWLLAQQELDSQEQGSGRFGAVARDRWIYNHALATWACAELLTMSYDERLRQPVAAAVELILRVQNADDGWRYGYGATTSDTSVTAFVIAALRAASTCAELGLVDLQKELVDGAMDRAAHWVRKQADRHSRYCYGAGLTSSSFGEPSVTPAPLPASTAAGLFAQSLARHNIRKSEHHRQALDLLDAQLPQWAPGADAAKAPNSVDLCYWYFGTFAQWIRGGEAHERWRRAVSAALLPTQIQVGPDSGSWDPIGRWGVVGGRVYATALSVMILEFP